MAKEAWKSRLERYRPHCGIYARTIRLMLSTSLSPSNRTPQGITLMGDNWIGAGAIVLDGVTLGKGTVVGAGAVVTKTFPWPSDCRQSGKGH